MLNTRTLNLIRAGLAGLPLVLAACSSLPERVDVLDRAHASLKSAEQDPLAQEAASIEIAAAREALTAADAAYADGEDLATVEYHAYVADRHAQIAAQRIAEAHAREQIEDSRAERDRILLEARRREAARQADRAREAEQRVEKLADQLESVKAEQTDRGMVLTLGDILFDTDRASLKPGAAETLDQLGEFLAAYPDRRVRIEGHADARGPAVYNVNLSERRAEAVATALERRGIDDDRIQTVGLGESEPVASNDTAAGRQQNRRVEIVLSDASGAFPLAQARPRRPLATGEVG